MLVLNENVAFVCAQLNGASVMVSLQKCECTSSSAALSGTAHVTLFVYTILLSC